MTKRKVFHITPSSDSGWNIRLEGSHKNVRHSKTKQQAIEYGRKLAKRTEPSQIIVHKKDGRIQTEFTYGSDPRKSKG